MKALYFEQHGSPQQLKYGELPEPVPGDGEVLIRVRAAALNHLDLWVLKGWPGLKLPLPHIGGADIAGEIAALGPGVSQTWTVGDRVVINPGFLVNGPEDEWTKRGEESLSPRFRIRGEHSRGGFAEYTVSQADSLLPLPQTVGFSEAAAPLLAGITAWRMLKIRGRLSAGETALIVGAGGGVNSISIQIAKLLGASVIALSSSERKLELAKELGADKVINYKQTPEWAREVKRLTGGRGADLVVDNVGQATFMQSLHAACRGGRIVTVGNTSGPAVTFDNRLLFLKQVSIIGSTMGSGLDFEDVTRLVWNNQLKPVIDRIIPLAEGIHGYRALASGEQFGKIILEP